MNITRNDSGYQVTAGFKNKRYKSKFGPIYMEVKTPTTIMVSTTNTEFVTINGVQYRIGGSMHLSVNGEWVDNHGGRGTLYIWKQDPVYPSKQVPATNSAKSKAMAELNRLANQIKEVNPKLFKTAEMAELEKKIDAKSEAIKFQKRSLESKKKELKVLEKELRELETALKKAVG